MGQQPILPWAALAVDVTADFTGPQPVYEVRPIEEGTRGARLLSVDDSNPGGLFLHWQLEAGLPRARRNIVSAIEVPMDALVNGIAPFQPINIASAESDDDREFVQIVVTSDPPPPMGSPSRTLRYYIALGVVARGP